MKQRILLFALAFIIGPFVCPDAKVKAACTGSDMTDGSFCVSSSGFSTVGGGTASDNFTVFESNMYPYKQRETYDDLEFSHGQAVEYYTVAYNFQRGLLLIGVVADQSTPQGRMLLDPQLNYESAGLLADFESIEANLISARDTFAYDVYSGYIPSDGSDPQKQLMDTIKLLASLYLMIGDEFLIDAIEFRFSPGALGLDTKLDEQICLLGAGASDTSECGSDTPQYGAQHYYEKAVNSFIYGFSPTVGTDLYISDYFDDAVFSLFNLSTERLSMALREKSSRQLVRQMSPDSTQEWTTARQTALANIRNISTSAYLAAAAAAAKAETSGIDFDVSGGDSLTGALAALRKQGNIYTNGLNPLGYDKRYVPMFDFENLYNDAKNIWLAEAKNYKGAFELEKRNFDSNYEALQNQIDSLQNSYGQSLESLTGCTRPANPNNPAEVAAFVDCTGVAGGDLFDCPMLDVSAATFGACVTSKATTGVLASKYRNIMEAQIRLNIARLNRDNILEKIKLENQRNITSIKIKRSQQGAQTALLSEYYEKLKNARTETDTVENTLVRNKKSGKWVKDPKLKTHKTTETFSIRDDRLQLDTDQSKELLKITTDYEIQLMDLESAIAIKNMLLAEAEAEIEIELAAHQKNSAVADFDNTFKEKESQWFLYQKSLNQLRYYSEKIPYLRVLKSQAAINLSDTLNTTAHFAYLAAKALEYQNLEPIDGGNLRLTDLFKAQTPDDISVFLDKLWSLNTLSCPWGALDATTYYISLSDDILGLSALSPSAKKEKVQAFINEHINSQGKLEFSFTISEGSSFLGISSAHNIKIWNGAIPSVCDPLNRAVKGVAVAIITSQTREIRSKIKLSQSGHSTFRNATGDVLEYIPVYDYHFLLEGSGDYAPYRQVDLLPFVNLDPRTQTSTGEWKGTFKGRGVSSSEWKMLLLNSFGDMDLGKIQDIRLYLDAVEAYN